MKNKDENRWEYSNPANIFFGPGRFKELPALAGDARNILLVTTPGFTGRGVTKKLRDMFPSEKNIIVLDNVAPNPDLSQIEDDYRHLSAPLSEGNTKKEKFDLIIALGGGSAIDTGKVFSYLFAEKIAGTKAADGAENLRRQFEMSEPFYSGRTVPLIAVPTTAGTGSEVTPFATVWDKKSKKKYSLLTPELYPDKALLDPELTLTLPEEITVYTALDALSHAFEAYWNNNSNPVSNIYAVKAIKTIMNLLPALVNEPESPDLRTSIMEASLFAGMAIAITRTALAHSISYPITARFDMPHGLACSFTLPAILRYNCTDENMEKMAELITETGNSNIAELVEYVENFFRAMGIKKRIAKYFNSPEQILNLTAEMYTPGRADNNLRTVDEAGIKDILKNSL